MPFLLLLLAITGRATAADCPTELATHKAALESAAVELEVAAAAMEKLQLEVEVLDDDLDEAEADLDEAEDELDDAVELLALLRGAATANPEQPLGDYQLALSCFFDADACPAEATPADATEAAANGPIAPPEAKKKGLFQKK